MAVHTLQGCDEHTFLRSGYAEGIASNCPANGADLDAACQIQVLPGLSQASDMYLDCLRQARQFEVPLVRQAITPTARQDFGGKILSQDADDLV